MAIPNVGREQYLAVLKFEFQGLCLDFQRIHSMFPNKTWRRAFWRHAKGKASSYINRLSF